MDLTGLPIDRPDDPEPEFVDINDEDIAAVSLQENNALALVDLRTLEVVGAWDVGAVTQPADTQEDDIVSLADEIIDSPRLPDAIGWLSDGTLALANEGEADLTGGRNISVHDRDGAVLYNPTEALELAVIAHGHYNDGRSGAKGIEPEGIEVGVFDGTEYIFGAIERGSGVSLHAVGEEGPVFLGYLPMVAESEPEGLKAMPEIGLLVAADEKLGKLVFYAADVPSTYPAVQRSTPGDLSGSVGWGALSGFVDAPSSMLYAVPDSAYQSSVYVLDVAGEPADIVDEMAVIDPDALLPEYLRGDTGRALLDLEGVAVADEGLWLVSEGENRPDNNVRPNLLVRVDADGVIQEVVELPFPKQEIALVDEDGNVTGEVREISVNANRFGFEGVTVANDKVLIAFQRTWGDDDPGIARIGEYDPSTGEWAFYGYKLDASANNPGLSEIVAIDAETFAVIERDGANGSVDPPNLFKVVKTFSIADATPTPNPEGEVVPLAPEAMVTPAPELIDLVGSTPGDDLEKWECLALKDGTLFVANDNDGAGETRLFRIEDFASASE